jgi:hypothetical protein
MLLISPVAPSTVCTIDIASFALRAAMFKPEICPAIRFDIASPAASSIAELIRNPVESRSMEVDIARLFLTMASRAMLALMFVFITVIREFLLALVRELI